MYRSRLSQPRMTDTPVVPPRPKWRLVKRRVKARRWGLVAGFLILGVIALTGFDLDALVERSGALFWLAISLFGVAFVCLLVAGFYLLTEQPREVEVLEDRFDDTNVIHLTGRQ